MYYSTLQAGPQGFGLWDFSCLQAVCKECSARYETPAWSFFLKFRAQVVFMHKVTSEFPTPLYTRKTHRFVKSPRVGIRELGLLRSLLLHTEGDSLEQLTTLKLSSPTRLHVESIQESPTAAILPENSLGLSLDLRPLNLLGFPYIPIIGT